MKSPDFQAQNRPVREIQLLVFSNTPDDHERITKFLKECSDIIEEQVGIRLRISGFQPIKWSGLSARGVLTDMHREAGEGGFDMAVAFTGRLLPQDSLVLVGLGGFVGVIDDTYRKYVVVRVMDKYVFIHEFFHAFIFNQAHSQVCIMSSGFYPLGRGCVWLGEDDRREVLQNKWRSFDEKPRLADGYDFIAEN